MAGQIGSGVRSNLDELVAEMLGDVGKLHDQIKALPPELRESLAPSLGAIAQAMKDGQKSIDDYAKGQAPVIKGFAAAELSGMRKAFTESSADVVALIKKDLAAATDLHRSALQQAGYREPWGAWHYIILAIVIAAAIWGVYFGVAAIRQNGFDAGKIAGWNEAAEAKAAASWANTEEGKLAYQLAKAGTIKNLAECSGKNWTRNEKERSCFGYPSPGGGTGDGWFYRPK